METNESAPVDAVEQEDQASVEEVQETQDDSYEESGEETVTIPKSKFNKLHRKALAYDGEKSKPRPSINNRSSDDKWKQKMELAVKGYSDEEISFVIKNGGARALEDPFVTSAIETMREKKKAEAASLGNEGSKSTVEKQFNPQEFSKLSAEEQLKKLSSLT